MKNLLVTTGLALAIAVPLNAADIVQAAEALAGRKEAAAVEHAGIVREIEEEKVPLVKERNLLEARAIKLRQDVERMEGLKAGHELLKKSAKDKVEARRKEVDYVTGLIADYSRNFETRVQIAEVQRYRGLIEDARTAANNNTLSAAQRLQQQLPLVEASIGRLKGLLGGDAFDGEALGAGGRMVSGRMVLLGPLTLFAGSGAVGTVESALNSTEPNIVAPPEEHVAQIRQLVESGSGTLPVDASGGNARKLAETKDTLVGQWKKGGPVMVPILALGFISILVGLLKWLQIARIRQAGVRDVQIILEHLRGGRKSNALEHAERLGGPAGNLLKRAVENANEDKELLEEMLYETMLDTRPRLEKWMPVIALTAATAPLLGLLGTVTGMINTFNLISVFGTGDPRMLSSGISEALITTEYGLIVAIPALLLHASITRKAKGVLGSMEQAAVSFINGAPKEQPPVKKP